MGEHSPDHREGLPARLSNGWKRMHCEQGFTLVEVLVAMVIGVILMVALTLTLTSSLRSVRQNRTVEQATAIGIEQLEFARSLSWDELQMDSSVSSDPRVVNPPPLSELVGSTVGLPANEALVVDAAFGLVPYDTVETLDTQEFQIHNYVTDAGTDLRRVVVVVEWTVGSASRSHQITTLISEVATG